MRDAFERDHGPLCADKDMQKYFARHEGAMKWAWQSARTVPEGFVMVPVEPTSDMVCAAIDAGTIDSDDVLWVWGEMLSAAPEPKK